MKTKEFYRRRLPHWQPLESTFFVTYRLVGSLPLNKINELKCLQQLLTNETKFKVHSPNRLNSTRDELFNKFDDYLDENPNGPYWLKYEKIARLVLDSLKFNHNRFYSLWGATVMPNHVHALLSTSENAPSLNVILQNHKKFTAVHANKILERNGQFWQRESFDRIVWNNEQFENTLKYIVNNPVKARLTDNWKNWPSTYVHPTMMSILD